jgi:hypothetical protein
MGVWGTRLGSDVYQTRHEQNTSPQTLDPAPFGGRFGDVAGDALTSDKNFITQEPAYKIMTYEDAARLAC